MPGCRIVFITGTDTGVGKTVLTGLLLSHLRQRGCKALAIKPFCSGSRSDPMLLRSLQGRELAATEINPFYFPEAVAPLVSARKHGNWIRLETVVAKIRSLARQCDWLLVEGAGGLLVPLGEGYSVLDLITRLKALVVVASRNKLGTLNHTLLTVSALRGAAIRRMKVVLMGSAANDLAARSNPQILSELLEPTPLYCLPFLGKGVKRAAVIKKSSARLAATLARVLE